MLKPTTRKQGEFTYVNISVNLQDIVSLTVELVDWPEELGDARSQATAWKLATSQSEQPGAHVTSCGRVHGNKTRATLTLACVPVREINEEFHTNEIRFSVYFIITRVVINIRCLVSRVMFMFLDSV